jgi:lipoprotein signal peptidase
MKKFLGIFCIIGAVSNLFDSKGSFGFVPLSGAEAFGFNIAVTLFYVGAIYFIYSEIQNHKNKKQHNGTETK